MVAYSVCRLFFCTVYTFNKHPQGEYRKGSVYPKFSTAGSAACGGASSLSAACVARVLYGNLPCNNTDISEKTRTCSGENVDNVRRIHVGRHKRRHHEHFIQMNIETHTNFSDHYVAAPSKVAKSDACPYPLRRNTSTHLR